MHTNKVLELYTELNERVKEGRRFFGDTFLNQEYAVSAPQLTVIDLGAWQGDYTFFCMPFAKKIYSIEPDPVPYQILKETVEKYELTDIKTFPICIGGSNGTRKMNMSHYGGSAFSDSGDVVDCKTLATFINENEIDQVDILKIDVESAEYEILSAPDFHTVAPKIKYIIGEFHRGYDEIGDTLEKLGYKVRCITGQQLFEATR